MSKTIIVFAPPSPWRRKIQDLLKHCSPGLHIFPTGSLETLEKKFRIKLFPDVLCLLTTGWDRDDTILYNLIEQYLYDQKTDFIFLKPEQMVKRKALEAYEINFEGYLLMPLSPEQVVAEIIRKLELTPLHTMC